MAMRRRRVLFHPFFFLPEPWNGIDEHLRLLVKHLDSERFEFLILEHGDDGPQTRLLAERAGIHIIPAPYARDDSALSRLKALQRLYMAERIDLLHLHSPVAGGQAVPALAARLAGVGGTLATYHQIQPAPLPPQTRVINRFAHTFLVDRTIAVSADVRQSLIRRAGLPQPRVLVIHNGIDLSSEVDGLHTLPARGADEVCLAYFGRLSPEKGLPVLLQALALLAPRCPNARTWIVGDGPDRAGLEALAKQLGIAEKVEFLGFRPDARCIMEHVDIVVHVPAYEGFGLVLLEAMAAGQPVVVNDAPGGMCEIVVHERTGLIVPAGSPEFLANALLRLVDDPQERQRLGRNGRTRCEEEFSAQRMAQRIAQYYESVLDGRRVSPRPAVAT